MRDGFSTKNVCLSLLQKHAKREGIIINIYEINASLSSPPPPCIQFLINRLIDVKKILKKFLYQLSNI